VRLCRRLPRKGVECCYYLCALSDGSGNALDRTRAHIADREDARQVGFERPVHVRAGPHKALVIEHHARPRQPLCIRIRTDEYKKVADRELRLFSGSVGATADRFENPVLPLESGDRRLGQDFDVRPCGDAFDQVARHVRFETGSANDQPDLGDLAGQIHRPLAGGIAPTHQRHFLPRAQPSLQRRGPIMDA